MTDRVGQQLGNYWLLRLLGSGGFAEVYLGQHVRLNTYAAIKVLRTHIAGADVESFEREAQIIASLVHPHIVHVWDFDVEQGVAFLVMDYAPSGSLRTLHPKGRRIPLPVVLLYVHQVANALQFAHDRHLIHRDVKPENILLKRQGEVLLSDFGIATIVPTTNSPSIFQGEGGTYPYMAPEQIKGKPVRASDQYALAICVYEWLTGTRPFKGTGPEIAMQHLHADPPPLQRPGLDISPKIEAVVLKALSKDPKERFPTIRAFADALQAASHTEAPAPDIETIPTLQPVSTVPLAPSALSPLQLRISGSDENELKPQSGEMPFFPQKERSVRSLSINRQKLFLPLVLLLLFVLLLSGGGMYFLLSEKSSSGSTSPGSAASPGVQQTRPVKTVAALLSPSPTPAPTPSPTTNPLVTATAAAALQYYTQYTNGTPTQEYTPGNLGQWINGSPGYGSCENNGAQGYDIVPKTFGDTEVCVAPPPGVTSGDFAVQVALTVNHGTGAALGFGFALPTAGKLFNGEYYYFGFCRVDSGNYCPSGDVFLDHAQNGAFAQCMGPDPNPDYSTSGNACSKTFAAVNTPLGATNVLTVIVVRGAIYLYLNTSFIMVFQPTAPVNYSPYGQVGVAAVEGGEATDVTFQSLKIWKVQS